MRFPFLLLALVTTAWADPVPVILDTDMGNDVDDVMALAMLHALEARGHCKLLAVTVSKDHPLAARFVDAVDTFYGRPDVPVGIVRDGPTPDPGKFTRLALETWPDGSPVFPHDLSGDVVIPEATRVLRETLAGQPDGSVILVQVGFSTNLARLLASGPDSVSSLPGKELVRRKVRLLSLMAGAFQPIDGNARYGEYNLVKDLPAARTLAAEWPTPRIWSGFEIGIAAPYPHESIERDYGYASPHPLKEAYLLYQPPPHDRPTWDPTAVLAAVLPDRAYFELSEAGTVTIDDGAATRFEPGPDGLDRYLILPPAQVERVREAIVQLSSQPPAGD